MYSYSAIDPSGRQQARLNGPLIGVQQTLRHPQPSYSFTRQYAAVSPHGDGGVQPSAKAKRSVTFGTVVQSSRPVPSDPAMKGMAMMNGTAKVPSRPVPSGSAVQDIAMKGSAEVPSRPVSGGPAVNGTAINSTVKVPARRRPKESKYPGSRSPRGAGKLLESYYNNDKRADEPKRKVIVTGGAGLIGLHIVEALLARDEFEVYVYDDYSNSNPTEVPKAAIQVEVDLSDREKTCKLIEELKPEIIYHLACHPYEGLSQFCPADISTSTMIATLNVVSGAVAAGTVKRIVNYSSMARYGAGQAAPPKQMGGRPSDARGAPFQEWYEPNPADVYACAKVAAERSLEILCDLHGIEWCHVVPHNIYGEANAQALSDPYRGVLLIWTNCMLRDQPFFIYGDGEQKRAPSYIGDCIEPMLKMGLDAAANRQTVNIGSHKEYTLNEMAEVSMRVFQEETGRTPKKPIHEDDRPCEVKDAWCSIGKSISLLGYEDKTSLEEGMRKLVRWAARNWPNGLPPRYMKEFEIEKKAPKVWTQRMM